MVETVMPAYVANEIMDDIMVSIHKDIDPVDMREFLELERCVVMGMAKVFIESGEIQVPEDFQELYIKIHTLPDFPGAFDEFLKLFLKDKI